MPVELKPCPFCGGTDLFIERLDYSSAFVQCDSEVSPGCACMARGPVGSQDDDGEDIPGAESAVREWNRRADQQTVAKLQARVAELEAALYEAQADAGAFRKAAQLGLTLRFHGGCAQSGAPGSPSAYEVVRSDNNVMAMREAVLRASSVIESAWGLGS